ncbi:hypothetical protein HKD37_06G015609 [Glycine soja]
MSPQLQPPMKHGHPSPLPCSVSDTTPTPVSRLSLMCLTGVHVSVSVSCPVSMLVSVLHRQPRRFTHCVVDFPVSIKKGAAVV